MEIKNICAAGGGTMGRQIALNAAIYGCNATVYDIKPEVCEDIARWEEQYLAQRIEKGRMTAETVAGIKERFSIKKDLTEAVAGAQCVIEAVPEIFEIKRDFFKQLDAIVGEDVIIATNSSYMVSSLFADCVKNPARLANMHFYHPALVMKFVEVVQGPHTASATCEALMEFCRRTGKTPIWMKKEIDGFAANRIIRVITAEAKWLVANGYCSIEDIDLACENGLGHPMGPFRLMDLSGLDLVYDMMRAGYEKTGKKDDLHDMVESLVKQGRLGRKTGHGFYDYE